MLYAIRETDVKEVLFEGVTFMIKPLPYRVKRDIINETALMTIDRTKVIDLSELAVRAVKHGVTGWKDLRFEDGEVVEPALVDCPDYKIKCLSQDSIELLYRTSIFDNLSSLCLDNTRIEDHIKETAKKRKSSRKQLEDLKKK